MKNAPIKRPVAANQGQKGIDEKAELPENSQKGIFEQKLEQLKKLAMDYAESLLSNENDIDVVVLRYMINDLLPPLQSLKLNTDALILQAIKERNLPFILNGTTYSRQGPRLKMSGRSTDLNERSTLQAFSHVVSGRLQDARSITMDQLAAALEAENFSMPEDETIESMLERSIKLHYIKGYIDLESGLICRQKTENEAYQEQFLKELDRERDIQQQEKSEPVEENEDKIPGDLEALLLSPERPREIGSVLEKTEKASTDIEDFIMDACQVGKAISVMDLSKQLKTRVRDEQLDIPFQIDQDAVERMLEKMVEDRKLSGYFEDDVHFIRKK